jgi:hypothetical protein
VQLVAGALKSLPNFYLTVKLDFALPGHSSPCQSSTSLCNLLPGHSSPCQTSTSSLNLTSHSAAYAPASASEAEQEKYHSAAPEAATNSISSPPLSLSTAAPSGWSLPGSVQMLDVLLGGLRHGTRIQFLLTPADIAPRFSIVHLTSPPLQPT